MTKGWKYLLGGGMAVLLLCLICIVIEPIFNGVPFDLTDPNWGRLSVYHAAIRQMHDGMPESEILSLIRDRPYMRTNTSDILLTWRSQQGTGDQLAHLQVTHLLRFDKNGRLTSIEKNTDFDTGANSPSSNRLTEVILKGNPAVFVLVAELLSGYRHAILVKIAARRIFVTRNAIAPGPDGLPCEHLLGYLLVLFLYARNIGYSYRTIAGC
jgi:hypothetical protein